MSAPNPLAGLYVPVGRAAEADSLREAVASGGLRPVLPTDVGSRVRLVTVLVAGHGRRASFAGTSEGDALILSFGPRMASAWVGSSVARFKPALARRLVRVSR